MRPLPLVAISFGVFVAAAGSARSATPTPGGDLPATAVVLIKQAGGAASEADRLAALRALQAQSELAPALRKDLDAFVRFVERWNDEYRMEQWWDRPVRAGAEPEVPVPPDSPLRPLAELYRGRMFFWCLMEYGDLKASDAARKRFYDRALESFRVAREAFPDNPIPAMYLGTPVPWEKDLPEVPGAPEWAGLAREHLERLADVIHWWAEHRQRPDGSFGGGWNDDCEMWLWWAPVLLGFDDPTAAAAQRKLSEGMFAQPHMNAGYTSRMGDVEHTAEDSTDTLVPMMVLAPEEAAWRGRAVRLADLMESVWTGRNARGRRQFRGYFYNAAGVRPDRDLAFDVIGNARPLHPLFLYWQRTRDERVGRVLTEWLDTWAEAAAREENGKPAGALPAALRWPSGAVDGDGGRWYQPVPPGGTMEFFYAWPSEVTELLDGFVIAYGVTGREQYLEPLRALARLRLMAFEGPQPAGSDPAPAPGSPAWCAEQLGPRAAGSHRPLAWSLAKARALAADPLFDAVLARDLPAAAPRTPAEGTRALVDALARSVEVLRWNFAGLTEEVRYTDQVLIFPVYGPAVRDPQRRAPVPTALSTDLLYRTVTGDPGSPRLPTPAVRWRTPPRDIATRVTRIGADALEAELFHFGAAPRQMEAEFLLLRPGRYRLALGDAADGPEFVMAAGSGRVGFTLPARELVRLRVMSTDQEP